MKISRKKLIFICIVLVIIALLVIVTVNMLKSPDKKQTQNIPTEYMISKENTMEIQSGLKCSGFAAAYILRHFDQDISGNKAYDEIADKNKDGTVSPYALKDYLNSKGLKSSVLGCSSIDDIKAKVSQGNPVIAFITTTPGGPYLHYDCIVGYDKDNLYFADSLTEMVNCKEKSYNRKISNKEFMALWKNNIVENKEHLVITAKQK